MDVFLSPMLQGKWCRGKNTNRTAVSETFIEADKLKQPGIPAGPVINIAMKAVAATDKRGNFLYVARWGTGRGLRG
jgi:hypothetical protein